ncbi:MAG: HIT family protein [Lachnospirales bacterium]
MDCIFCKIISGEFSSHKVYEDEVCIGFLDINPLNNGHVLVLPKKHFIGIFDIDEETLNHIMKVVKTLSAKVQKAVNSDGITIVQNNGLLQEVKHLHFHIIPTFENSHGISFSKLENPENFEKIANKIKSL